jgi:oligopeptide/dipeptide ABC transporter ATP-binding protein
VNDTLLQVRNLRKYFPVERGVLRRGNDFIRAVDDISFSVVRGTILGLIGESGCGKTTTVKTIMRAIPPTSGSIEYTTQDNRSVDLAQLTRKELKPLRKEIQMIFQDPFSSLNPRMTALDIVAEPLKVLKWRKPDYRRRVEDLMDLVGLDPRFLSRYPHAFSGGQRQRLGIARALASSPSLLFADEPVSALDVSVQAQILNLLLDIQAQMGLTVLIIAHDLGVVRYICKKVAIMYLGKIVEQGDTREIYTHPRHPYTAGLLAASPDTDPDTPWAEDLLTGDVPSPIGERPGCVFASRCAYAEERCSSDAPELAPVSGADRAVACWRADELHLRGI